MSEGGPGSCLRAEQVIQLIVMPSTVLIGDCGHEGNVIDPVAMLINKVTKSHE